MGSSSLIQGMTIGQLISKEIMRYIPYIESTLDSKRSYNNTGYMSYYNGNRIAHLITTPSICKHEYILKSFKFYCGGLSEISVRIGKLQQYNKRINFDNLLYKAPKNIIIEEGHKLYAVDDINVILKSDSMYVIEPYCTARMVGSGKFKDCKPNDFDNLKFVRSDLRWLGWHDGGYYLFENHVKRFECVFVLHL